MLSKLKAAIAGLTHALGAQKLFRKRALNRMHARLQGETKAEHTAQHLETLAERLRTEAFVLSNKSPVHAQQKITRADRISARADLFRAKAEREHARYNDHKAAIRTYTQRIEKIDTSIEAAEKELAKLGPTVDYEHQKTTGGTFRAAWVTSNVASWHRYQEGIRAGRYSQYGHANIHIPYGPGPWSGRDDCSSYVTSQALACGADDPNGLGFSGEGFTGTLVNASGGWKQVSLQTMMNAGQGYIVYGYGNGHHTEDYAPSESDPYRTIGHGSSPVDPSTIFMFGTSEYQRYFIFDPS